AEVALKEVPVIRLDVLDLRAGPLIGQLARCRFVAHQAEGEEFPLIPRDFPQSALYVVEDGLHVAAIISHAWEDRKWEIIPIRGTRALLPSPCENTPRSGSKTG